MRSHTCAQSYRIVHNQKKTWKVISSCFQIAFAFGLMIAVCIQMFGHVSGGHMNPAVSIAMAVVQAISPTRALFYVCAQSAGGILGSLLLKA